MNGIKKSGAQFAVNASVVSSFVKPSTTSLEDGRLVVVWDAEQENETNQSGLKGRIYAENGLPQGNEFTIGDGSGHSPVVVALTAAQFVVFWEEGNFQDIESLSIAGQIYSDEGQPLGAKIIIQSERDLDVGWPTVSALPGQGFFVAFTHFSWLKNGVVDAQAEVNLTRFSLDGTKFGERIVVVSGVGMSPQALTSTALPNGEILVSWLQNDDNVDFESLNARSFEFQSGNLLSSFVIARKPLFEISPAVSVAVSADATVLFTWEDSSYFVPVNKSEIRGRIFDATGRPIVAEFPICEFPAALRRNPKATALSGGGFLVGWEGQQPIQFKDDVLITLNGQRLSSVGARFGYEFLINTELRGSRYDVSLSSSGDASLFAVWTSSIKPEGTEISITIVGQRFEVGKVESDLGLFGQFEPVFFPVDDAVFEESFICTDPQGTQWNCSTELALGDHHLLFPFAQFAVSAKNGIYPVTLRHIKRMEQDSKRIEFVDYSLTIVKDDTPIETDSTPQEKAARAENFFSKYSRLGEIYSDIEAEEFLNVARGGEALSILEYIVELTEPRIYQFLVEMSAENRFPTALDEQALSVLSRIFAFTIATNILLESIEHPDGNSSSGVTVEIGTLIVLSVVVGVIFVMIMYKKGLFDQAIENLQCAVSQKGQCNFSEKAQTQFDFGINTDFGDRISEAIERSEYYKSEINKYCIIGDYTGRWIEQTPDGTNSGPSRGTGKLDVVGSKVSGTSSSGPMYVMGSRTGSTISLSSVYGGQADLEIASDGSVSGSYSYSIAQNEDGFPEQGSGTISGNISCNPPEQLKCSD